MLKPSFVALSLVFAGLAGAADVDLYVTDYNENPTAEQRPLIDQALTYAKPKAVTVQTADGKTVTVESPAAVSVRKELTGNAREARLTASIGEFEPFSFLLRPKADLQQVMIAGGDLKGPDGAVIPAANVKVCSIEEFQGAARDILMPLGAPWDMSANSTEFFWVTVRVPADAKPGAYAGPVTVTAQGKPVAALNVALDVLPIRLKDVPFALGYNYSYPGDAKALATQCQDMRDHGMTTVAALYNWHLPVNDKDTTQIVSLIEAYKAAAFPAVLYFASPMDLQLNSLAGYGDESARRWQQKYIQVMRLMHQEFTQRDVPVLFSIGDELTNKGIEGVQTAGRLAKLTYEELPEIATTSDMNGYEEVMAMAPYLNVATFNNGWDGIDHHNKGRKLINKEFILALREKTGAIPWFVNANSGRFPFGFFFWKMTKYGVQGKVEWYYNLGNNERGSVVRTDGQNVYPTMEYERSREGIDDLKYVCLLEDLVARARKAGKAADQTAKAEQYLKQLADGILDDWTLYAGKNAAKFPADGFEALDAQQAAAVGSLNALRLQLAGHIMALQTAMGN